MATVLKGINGQVAEAPATDEGAAPRMTDAQRLEMLAKLSPDELDGMERLVEMLDADEPLEDVDKWIELETRRLNRAKSRKEAATAAPAPQQAEAPKPKQSWPEIDYPTTEYMIFTEPEIFLQPVAVLAQRTFAYLLRGETGAHLFGDDYLDADNFEKLHGLYLDIRAGIASGFPGIDLDAMHLAIRECENKAWH